MLNLLHKDSDLSQQTTIWFVPLTKLEDNPYQTRAVNDPGHVIGLAASILQMRPSMPETKGLQSPPTGRLVNWSDGTVLDREIYEDPDALAAALQDAATIVELGFGHSRRLAFLCLANGVDHVFKDLDPATTALTGIDWDAAEYAGMPVTLRYLTDREMWEHAITENAQRRDLTAIEEAMAIERARKELGMTYDEAGKIFGKSRGAAANLVRLLQLPEHIQQAILNGTITERHGRALLALKPAPHLYESVDMGIAAGSIVAATEALVRGIIRRQRPLPPALRTGYQTREFSDSVETLDPPWDYDWVPEDDHAPGIVGACNGCQWRATFAGDAGPRCTQPRPKGGVGLCYDRKATAWRQLEVARQAAAAREAIRAAAAAQAAEAEEAAAKAALARQAAQERQADAAAEIDKPLVEWTDADYQAYSAASQPPAEASTTPAPAAAAALPDAPVAVDGEKQVVFFGGWQAPAALVERGLCSQEKCECFVLAYDRYPGRGILQPDPEHAPNMCYGCTSPGRLSHRKKQLEFGDDLGARRAAIKAENAEVLALLKRVFYGLAAEDIWNNTGFLPDFAYLSGLYFADPEKLDALQMQEKIWMAVASKHCMSNDNTNASEPRWNMERTNSWLKRLGWQPESVPE